MFLEILKGGRLLRKNLTLWNMSQQKKGQRELESDDPGDRKLFGSKPGLAYTAADAAAAACTGEGAN